MLLLFDIDGTLLTCGTQVREVLEEVFSEVWGRRVEVDGYDFAGKTDDQIARELLIGAGIGERELEAVLPRAKERYLEVLEERLDRRGMRLLPGVVELLERLGGRAGVAVGLLTGNWERGGRTKLARFDLNRHFPFGAFGDGHADRLALPPTAWRRAREHVGRSFAPEETWIVGDSPLDVACAREHGIRCLAVATGWTAAEELAAAGAEVVVDELRPAEAEGILVG